MGDGVGSTGPDPGLTTGAAGSRRVTRHDRRGSAGVRRAVDLIIRNWPLKLAAIGLATVLYAGVVLSENSRSWPGQVAIAVVDPPPGGADATGIGGRDPVPCSPRRCGPAHQRPSRATLDLSALTPEVGGPTVEVPVALVALDPRVQVVDDEPRTVDVQLDSVVSRTIPITVERGVAPEGLVLGPPQLEPASVRIRGASSRIAQVRSVIARV